MLKENEPRITGIYLENFQTLRNEPVFLNFDKLCLLYGPNSSGKSAVIDALDLLKKTVDIHNGLKAGGEYNLENIYRKHETLGNHHKLKIGIEIIVGKFESYGEQKTWYESPSRESNDVHKYTFDNAYKSKMQVEFLSGGKGIKVAFNGQPIFEIINELTSFNDSYKKISLEQQKKLDENFDHDRSVNSLNGKLILYKNTNLFEGMGDFCNFDFSNYNQKFNSRIKNSYFYDLFFEDYEDKLIINGISFDAQNQDEFMVEVDHDTTKFIENIEDNSYLHPEEYDEESIKFLRDKFTEKKEKDGQEIAWKEFEENLGIPQEYLGIFTNLADDYSKFIKGLFFQIQSAIQYSHVRGDRQVLNSGHCVAYDTTLYSGKHNFGGFGIKFNLSDPFRDNNDPIRIYAEHIANEISWGKGEIKFKDDFVNYCFQKYIPSLKQYKIIYKTYDITIRGDKSKNYNTLIYLGIEDKLGNQLGFQDVGSGVSYILPIISSLWCKQLSFIEQPELHLHLELPL